MSRKESIAVIGAGISGITAAKLEADKGHAVTLIDSSDRPGGLLKSDYIDGYSFDYGTHIIPETGLGALDDFLFGDLSSQNYKISKLIPTGNYYNGQLNEKSCYVDTTTLPTDVYNQGCVDILGATGADANNVKQWYVNRFGKTFAESIFCPVIEKYMGVSASSLSSSVGTFFDMSRLLAFDQEVTDVLGQVNRYYSVLGHHVRKEGVYKYYPKRGGVGTFVDHMMDKLPKKRVSFQPLTKIKSLEHADGVLTHIITEKEDLAVDRVIWTIPIALMALYAPLGVVVEKPRFRKTVLFDFVFNGKLNTDTTFVNVYDLEMKSGRITCYQNLSDSLGDKGSCTVEVLSDQAVTVGDILAELVQMRLVSSQDQCIFKKQRNVMNGFPILGLDYVEQSRKQGQHYRDYFKNITFLGKASEKSFFMTDVLKETYTTLVG